MGGEASLLLQDSLQTCAPGNGEFHQKPMLLENSEGPEAPPFVFQEMAYCKETPFPIGLR